MSLHFSQYGHRLFGEFTNCANPFFDGLLCNETLISAPSRGSLSVIVDMSYPKLKGPNSTPPRNLHPSRPLVREKQSVFFQEFVVLHALEDPTIRVLPNLHSHQHLSDTGPDDPSITVVFILLQSVEQTVSLPDYAVMRIARSPSG